MEHQGKHDIAHLETRIRTLSERLETMSDSSDLEELIIIIHRPGWTTPAEYQLVTGLVDIMQQQMEVLADLRQALVNGSRAIAGPVNELNPQPLPPG